MASKQINELPAAVTVPGTMVFAGDDGTATQKVSADQLFSLGASAARVTPLDANHIHAWELNDASGNFVDTGSSSSKVNVTVTTGTDIPLYQIPGLLGPCVSLGIDAAGGYNSAAGKVSANSFSDLPAGSCTLECWSETVNPALGALCGFSAAGQDNYVISGVPGDTMFSTIRGGSFKNLVADTRIRLGPSFTWLYAAATYDLPTGACKLYVNGEVIASATGQSGTILWANGTTPIFCIGNSNGGYQHYGKMSRVRLSNIARSQSYLRSVYSKAMGY